MTDFCVNLLELLKSWIMKIPDLSMNPSHFNSLMGAKDVIVNFIGAANFLVPINTILLQMSIVYGIKLVKFTIFVINWIVRRLADFFP